jgi:hypothetical protein
VKKESKPKQTPKPKETPKNQEKKLGDKFERKVILKKK